MVTWTYNKTTGAPVAQWDKRWLTDLAVPSSNLGLEAKSSQPLTGFFGIHSLSLSTSHRFNMTEMLLKRT